MHHICVFAGSNLGADARFRVAAQELGRSLVRRTLEEFFEVLTWAQLGLHRKPCGLLNVNRYFDRLLSFLDHSVDECFVRAGNLGMVLVSNAPDELLQTLKARTHAIEKELVVETLAQIAHGRIALAGRAG